MPTLGRHPVGNDVAVGEIDVATDPYRIVAVPLEIHDGDLWALYIGARVGHPTGGSATFELGIYEMSGSTITNRIYASGVQGFAAPVPFDDPTGGYNYIVRIPAGVKLAGGSRYAIAIRAASGVLRYGHANDGTTVHYRDSAAMPDPFNAATTSADGRLSVWLYGRPNRTPEAVILTPANNAVVNDATPDITVRFVDEDINFSEISDTWTLPEEFTAYEVEVIDPSGPSTVYDSNKTTTSSGQKASRQATHTVTNTLSAGGEYIVQARVWDSFDTSSDWTSINLTIGGGGTVSGIVLHTQSRVGSRNGYYVSENGQPYTDFVWSGNGNNLKRLWFQLRDMTTDQIIRGYHHSGDNDLNLPDGSYWMSYPQAWAPIPQGGRYRYEMWAMDMTGLMTPIAYGAEFYVNGPPAIPHSLAPINVAQTERPELSVTVTDVLDDEDQLDVWFEIKQGSTVRVLPAHHQGDGIFTAQVTAVEMPTHDTYQIRAVAVDPWQAQVEGPWGTFTYTDGPTVSIIDPDPIVTDSEPMIAWVVDKPQAAFRVIIRRDGEIVFGSGLVVDPDTREVFPGYLSDGTYEVTVWVRDTHGLEDEQTVSFTVDTGNAPPLYAEDLAALANAGGTIDMPEVNEIVIDGVRIPVEHAQATYTQKFEGKLTFGDYSVDSDQYQSTFAQSVWSGGLGIRNHQEGATDQRFRWARAWTLSARQLTLPLKPIAYEVDWAEPPTPTKISEGLPPGFTQGSAVPYPWIRHPRASQVLGCRNGIIYVACGKRMSAINARTGEVIVIGDLDAQPTGSGAWHALEDRDTLRLYIPLGEFGLQPFDPIASTIEANLGVEAVCVGSWDTKLFCVTTDGYVRKLTPAGWEPASMDARIPNDEYPRHILQFFTQGGDTAPAIVTDSQVWLYDDEYNGIHPHGMDYPRSPTAGEAATTWRVDGLYVANGLDVMRSSVAGVISPVGLDRDEGLELQGSQLGKLVRSGDFRITSMAASHNLMLATVRGVVETDSGTTRSFQELMAYNEAGWHNIAGVDRVAPVGEIWEPTTLLLNDGIGAYQAVWGETPPRYDDPGSGIGRIWTCAIPRETHAPLAPVSDFPVRFDDEGIFYLGWIDAGMEYFLKGWSHHEVTIESEDETQTVPDGAVDVYYRTEHDPATLMHIGTTWQNGLNTFSFRTTQNTPRGVTARRIEPVLVLRGDDDDTVGPIVRSHSIKFMKLSLAGIAWRFSVPLDRIKETYHGIGPNEIDDFLARLAAEGSRFGPFSEMTHSRLSNGEPGKYRVRVAQWFYAGGTGEDERKVGMLNIITIPIYGELGPEGEE